MFTFIPRIGSRQLLVTCGGLISCIGLVSEMKAAELLSPSQAAIDAAKGINLMSYDRDYSGGAHTNGAGTGGAAITLAVASYAGNTSADFRLLEQIRHTLTPGKEPTCNGGYPEQHNRHVTGMFVVVKNTPAIWGQLTTAEKARIDLIMKASLIGNAFTTSDNNPFIEGGTQQYTLDADSNLSRTWNPNYREGMVGGVLTGIAWFGNPAAAEAFLSTYDHAAFTAQLATHNIPNIHETFNWKTANPSSKAPTATQIELAVRNYRFFTFTVADHSKIYQNLVTDTYSANVNAGINDGAGINGAGKIVSGAASLPNKGLKGMLKEFASVDADGPRSSLVYCFDGYRPHMTNQIALIVSGLWPKGSATATQAATLVNIGNTDLWYKAEKGYISYAKGKSRGLADYTTYGASHGFVYNRSLWDDVLKPFHGLGGGVAPEFKEGTRIQTPASVTLRSSASGTATLVGTLPPGALGSVMGGPVNNGGVEWWQLFSDSGLTGWILRTEFQPSPSTEYVDSSGASWKNRMIPSQTGSFSLSFSMWASATGIDAVTGLSATESDAFADLAIAIRFAPTGVFDARNGGAYQAANTLTYQAQVLYRVTITGNVATRRYSATVTPPGGAPVEIASNYAFRTEQASVSSLTRLSAIVLAPAFHIVSGIIFEGAPLFSSPEIIRSIAGQPLAHTFATVPAATTFALDHLPAGWSFSNTTGLLEGTPGLGSYEIEVEAWNAVGSSGKRAFRVVVFANAADLWLDEKFGPAAADPKIAGWEADPDHDGLNNLIERAFNMEPQQSGVVQLTPITGTSGLPTVTLSNDGERRLRIEFVRRKSSSDPGITYIPEFYSSLVAGWVVEPSTRTVTSINTEWERVVVENSSLAASSNCFGRLRVTMP